LGDVKHKEPRLHIGDRSSYSVPAERSHRVPKQIGVCVRYVQYLSVVSTTLCIFYSSASSSLVPAYKAKSWARGGKNIQYVQAFLASVMSHTGHSSISPSSLPDCRASSSLAVAGVRVGDALGLWLRSRDGTGECSRGGGDLSLLVLCGLVRPQAVYFDIE
jgi:hypothetical protein